MDGTMHEGKKQSGHYYRLLWMMIASFIAMYILMYSMVDNFTNVIPNFNQFYMAGLMSAPMLIIELLIMGKMYPNRKMNTILVSLGVALIIIFFLLIRNQTAIGDKQFLKSMIPHHAGAILMVQKSDLTDPEIQELAKAIIESQNKEIEFMKAKIKELEGR